MSYAFVWLYGLNFAVWFFVYIYPLSPSRTHEHSVTFALGSLLFFPLSLPSLSLAINTHSFLLSTLSLNVVTRVTSETHFVFILRFVSVFRLIVLPFYN